MIALSSYLRLTVCLLLLIASILSAGVICAQTPDPGNISSRVNIAQDLELTSEAEQKHLPDAQRGTLWKRLALDYHAATDFSKAENAYIKALHLLKTDPSARAEYASTLDDLASLYLIYGRLDDAESARKQALTVRQKLGNTVDIAISEVHLADIALARHQFRKAERLILQGLAGMESSSNPPQAGMLSALITLTYARCSIGRCGEGMMSAKQAVAFANKNFESQSAGSGFALEAIGFAAWKSGATQEGERFMLQAIQMLRKELAPADPRLAGAMLQYHAYLVEAHRQVEAQVIQEQVTRMTSETGVFCRDCAVSVYSLSNSLR